MNEIFDEFQKEEYKNISNAHFESNKQIGIFFRYFLLIASAPAFIILLYGKEGSSITLLLNGNDNDINNSLFIGFFLIVISILGIFSCFYLISFRMDSILYARTVNGIRKYFYHNQYKKQKTLINLENHFRVLPTQINQPDYKQRHNFGVILYCFAFINSIYFALGTRIIASVGEKFFSEYFPFRIPIFIKDYNLVATIICMSFIFLIHLLYHNYIINHRLYSYMKNLTIGIDIDGVLNRHRDTFCDFLIKNTGIHLNPEDITHIPVHTIPNIKEKIGLERRHEYLVFNDINYWIQHKIIDKKVVSILKELKNISGYKIHIFSFRPWPDTAFLDKQKTEYLKRWWYFDLYRVRITLIPILKCFFSKRFLVNSRITLIKQKKWNLPAFKIFQASKIYSRHLRFFTIKRITRRWLNKNRIPYDKLTIEKNTIDIRSSKLGIWKFPMAQFRNRYYHAQRKSFRYFVEDDIKNAIKLCSSCEYVFLLAHPYNHYDNSFPSNLIRVNSWSEIKEHIRNLG